MNVSSLAGVVCALALCSLTAQAATGASDQYDLDIPQQPLDTALRAFAEQIAANFTDFTGATPTNKTVYDVLGRRFSAGVTVRF